jgi:hypothetical protein
VFDLQRIVSEQCLWERHATFEANFVAERVNLRAEGLTRGAGEASALRPTRAAPAMGALTAVNFHPLMVSEVTVGVPVAVTAPEAIAREC